MDVLCIFHVNLENLPVFARVIRMHQSMKLIQTNELSSYRLVTTIIQFTIDVNRTPDAVPASSLVLAINSQLSYTIVMTNKFVIA